MKKQIESFVMYEGSVDKYILVASHNCSMRGNRDEQLGAGGTNIFRRKAILLQLNSSDRIRPPIR